MQVITIQSEAFHDIVSKIDAINTRLTSKEKEPKEVWLDNQEFLQTLKISKRTAQHYRDTGLISFSQVGNKIYYKLADVEEMLKKHYNKSFKK
jgi:3-methyladenine DNA glycosylase Tag